MTTQSKIRAYQPELAKQSIRIYRSALADIAWGKLDLLACRKLARKVITLGFIKVQP